jgi:tail-anchored protein insertion receptor
MFWLPQGWMPYYAEWLLSFPRAPLGSVSIQAWALACSAVILLVSDAIIATVGLVMEMNSNPGQKTKAEPMKFAGDKTTAEKAPGKTGRSKKEL